MRVFRYFGCTVILVTCFDFLRTGIAMQLGCVSCVEFVDYMSIDFDGRLRRQRDCWWWGWRASFCPPRLFLGFRLCFHVLGFWCAGLLLFTGENAIPSFDSTESEYGNENNRYGARYPNSDATLDPRKRRFSL